MITELEKIYEGKYKLTSLSNKVKLSKFTDYIPLFDVSIYKIILSSKKDIYTNIFKNNHRIVTKRIIKWIKNMLEDFDKNSSRYKSLENSIKFIENYDVETLQKTYNTLTKSFHNEILGISICKRKSYDNHFTSHLNPYYSQLELLNLGLNIKVINPKSEIKGDELIDQDKHYEICKLISKNDVDFTIIENHLKYIIDNNLIDLIKFYSLYGSCDINHFLRTYFTDKIKNSKLIISSSLYLYEKIQKAPPLNDNYYFYRFVNDDKYLKDLEIGDTFVDNSFTSFTRDPFYVSGEKNTFGDILIKVNIPKNITGVGLFIELLSHFKYEEEFLLRPFTKLTLISKDDHFIYHHINKNFQEKITKKYEFEWSGFSSIPQEIDKFIDPKKYDYVDFIYNFNKNFEKFTKTICNEFDEFSILYKNKLYLFKCFIFNSTGVYKKFYRNKSKIGLQIILYSDNMIPHASFEMDKSFVVNYYNNFTQFTPLDDKELLVFSKLFCNTFNYSKFSIEPYYRNFSKFSKNIHSYSNLYNDDLYQFFKFNKKRFMNNNEITLNCSWWKLEKLKDENINILFSLSKFNEFDNFILSLKCKTIDQLFTIIVEKHFDKYSNLIDRLNNYFDGSLKERFYYKCDFKEQINHFIYSK